MATSYILIGILFVSVIYILFFKKTKCDCKAMLDRKPTILDSSEDNVDCILVDPKKENKVIYTLLKKNK